MMLRYKVKNSRDCGCIVVADGLSIPEMECAVASFVESQGFRVDDTEMRDGTVIVVRADVTVGRCPECGRKTPEDELCPGCGRCGGCC